MVRYDHDMVRAVCVHYFLGSLFESKMFFSHQFNKKLFEQYVITFLHIGL